MAASYRQIIPSRQTELTTGVAPARSRANTAYPRFLQQYENPERKWEREILTRLIELVQMEPDWDGYGAPSVKRDAGFFALEILKGIMRERTPLPQIVPSSVGGVQMEWHEKGIDLEVHVTGAYECEVWFRDHATAKNFAVDLTNDFSDLLGPIGTLTTR